MANIFASIIFGGIGFVPFVYGKKQSNLKALAIVLVLIQRMASTALASNMRFNESQAA